MFLNKAVYKVGHFIRIVSPATEISYLEAAWSGISMINDRPVEGVIDSMVDLNDYKMHFYTPEQKDCKFVISNSDRSYQIYNKKQLNFTFQPKSREKQSTTFMAALHRAFLYLAVTCEKWQKKREQLLSRQTTDDHQTIPFPRLSTIV